MIGILGGSFDPIHYGHLHSAQALYQQLHLSELRFIPCKNPVINKKVYASGQQRLIMLQRALQHYPYFSIDERELRRKTPSYTIDTLHSLRAELGNTPLGLILGFDNLASLYHWHKWTELIQYAHLLIVPRPDHTNILNTEMDTFVKKYQISDPRLLSQQTAGFLFMTHVKPLPISASLIRKKIANADYPTGLLPPTVLDYILQQKLYL